MVPHVDFQSLNGTLDGVVPVSLVRPLVDPNMPSFLVSAELTLLEAREGNTNVNVAGFKVSRPSFFSSFG